MHSDESQDIDLKVTPEQRALGWSTRPQLSQLSNLQHSPSRSMTDALFVQVPQIKYAVRQYCKL